MAGRKTSPFKIQVASDSALLARLGPEVSDETDARIAALAARIRELPGVVSVQPAYTSILVKIDPIKVGLNRFSKLLSKLDSGPTKVAAGREHTLPVCYDPRVAPDLREVARLTGLSEARVIALHTEPVYRVSFLGFLPGFAYLRGLRPELRVPRLPSARVRIPAGSVGLAEEQTGVYPLDSPGGWRLIGRSAIPVWEVGRKPAALLAPGDRLRFHAVSLEEFQRLGGKWDS